ncbi:hypothetical protein ANCCEY_14368 [Ancylostoma ceylanicum]|uniref:Uncharacterized protein n=1 Tax=Ancylostoma ceylanicum TaxID=53326 RepID=A0A0D6LFV0_9BILA|nr:hypothetical protein ANCCEY_14368 [Ancylostoma ceylanicum]
MRVNDEEKVGAVPAQSLDHEVQRENIHLYVGEETLLIGMVETKIVEEKVDGTIGEIGTEEMIEGMIKEREAGVGVKAERGIQIATVNELR